MEKAITNVKSNHVVNGVNFLGLVGVAGYTFKVNLDMKKKINSLEKELANMKSALQENNKRSTIAFTRLNQKIDNITSAMRQAPPVPTSRAAEEEPIIELDNAHGFRDEVSDAIHVLMAGGSR